MASEPANGVGIDGGIEREIIKVYKRKGKGQRKLSPFFAAVESNNCVTPPETLARESKDAAQEDVVAKNSIEAPSENLLGNDSDKVIDKPLVEAFPQDVGEKSVELPSQSQNDINTVVVDENSIKEPSKSLTQEDVTNMVVDKNAIEAPSQTLSMEDVNTLVVDKNPIEVSSEEYVHVVDVDDNQMKEAHPEQLQADSASGSMPMEECLDGRIRIHVPSQSKQQKEEIMKKLEDQLSLIRGLVKRIEDKEGEIYAYNDSRVLINNGGGRILSRPLNQLSISVLENTEHVEKEKRTPKANQFYRTSEFLLGDKLPPVESNKKSKSNAKKQGDGFVTSSKVFKNCNTLLERLMKHKHGWVFNAPVDVKALGLHDYFTIISHPMDLGTVKARLTKNLYKSPRDFAEDVRLTFHNAMTYNPEGQDVHVMAQQLLQIFEERFAVIEADYNRESSYEMRSRLGPTMPPPPPIRHPKPSTTPSGRTPALKKPKANEPNKRDMTYEEKQKLSGHLQNLPPDKLDAIVQIVNKRNTAVKLRDEEIEVDIDSVDPETLWELDRFVTNYKKGLSKRKRRAELAMQARVEAERNTQLQMASAPGNEFSREEGTTAKKTLPTQVHSQVEKQNNETSRSSSSSSSSSGSSSSSDSDSDSSSSSGSDQT